MRLLASAVAFVALTMTAFAMPPVPRKAPEFTIVESSGKQTLISSLKGKVVVMPFMFTTCPHCQREAQMLTKLAKEYGPKGLVVMGTVFDDATGPKAAQFIKEFQIGFPVGYSTRETVTSYLGISVMDRWVVPQVAIIDKKGNIVAQTEATGTPQLQDETYLRGLIEKLLAEGGAGAAPAKAPAKTSAVPAPPATTASAKK
jgi:peroxiredoxin